MKKLIFIFCILFSIQLSAQSGWEIAAGGGISSCVYKYRGGDFSSLSFFEPKIRPSYYLGIGYLIQNKKTPEIHYLFQARMEAKGMNVHWETNSNWPGVPSSDFVQPAYYATIRAEFQYDLIKGIYAAAGLENGYLFSKYNEDLKDILGENRYDLAGLLSVGYRKGRLRLHLDYSRSFSPFGYHDYTPDSLHSKIISIYYPYFIHFGVGVRI